MSKVPPLVQSTAYETLWLRNEVARLKRRLAMRERKIQVMTRFISLITAVDHQKIAKIINSSRNDPDVLFAGIVDSQRTLVEAQTKHIDKLLDDVKRLETWVAKHEAHIKDLHAVLGWVRAKHPVKKALSFNFQSTSPANPGTSLSAPPCTVPSAVPSSNTLQHRLVPKSSH